MGIVHLGDLGCQPPHAILEEIRGADVLLIPVGGLFTIDHRQATDLAKLVQPRICIPMHFRTNKIAFEIASVEPFLKDKKEVEKFNKSQIEITKETLPLKTKIVVLEPSH
jgi:L-ascorbate metabolism protein UlaG (beta-lactamase superfamily)